MPDILHFLRFKAVDVGLGISNSHARHLREKYIGSMGVRLFVLTPMDDTIQGFFPPFLFIMGKSSLKPPQIPWVQARRPLVWHQLTQSRGQSHLAGCKVPISAPDTPLNYPIGSV